MREAPEIVIVGMGYVGLTLSCTLASLGFRVWGYDNQPEVVSKLNQGVPHIFEPGVQESIQIHLGKNLTVEDRLPEKFRGVFILCVSTPITSDHSPDLRNLQDATTSIARSATEGATIIVRSTVPVGTCRNVVLPILEEQMSSVLLASCPERTIQGRALEEIRSLPQIIGGIDEASTQKAVSLWSKITKSVSLVSSLEAAEMVKLINNSHTDLIYSFGNEIALMAHGLGLDPIELIQAANSDYPRPDIARPGFVGGPCISKDPYILINSLKGSGYSPRLVEGARTLNESLPERVAQHFLDRINSKANGQVRHAKILICGFAYKGWPETDDLRDSPVIKIIQYLKRYEFQIYGHDPLVTSKVISSFGATPVENLEQGFDGAKGVLFINDHPDYRRLSIENLVDKMDKPAMLYDSWRMFDVAKVTECYGIGYAGIGFG